MHDVVLLMAVLELAYAAFFLLALSQPRHWSQMTNASPWPQRWSALCRIAAVVVLALAFGAAWLRDGAVFGPLLWGTSISLAAIGVTFTVTWQPSWLRSLLTMLLVK